MVSDFPFNLVIFFLDVTDEYEYSFFSISWYVFYFIDESHEKLKCKFFSNPLSTLFSE